MNQFINITSTLFIIYIVGYSIVKTILTITEIKVFEKDQKQNKLENRIKHEYYIPISILLPIHNDEKQAIKSIQSILKSNYKTFEIVIIDDDSKEKEKQTLIRALNLKKVNRPIRNVLKTKKVIEIYQTRYNDKKITYIRKEQGGKADSLNVGINACEYPYIIPLDSSYTLRKDTLENLFRPILEDDAIITCNGRVLVGNWEKEKYQFPSEVLGASQALEYNHTFSLAIHKQENLIALPTLTLFKKDIVVSVLGFDKDSTGENFELITKIKEYIKAEGGVYKTKYAPSAICFKNAKTTISEIIEERKNWNQSLRKTRKKYKKGNKQIPRFLSSIYGTLAPWINLLGIIFLITACLLNLSSWKIILVFLLSYLSLFACLSTCSFIKATDKIREKHSIIKIIGASITEVILLNTIVSLAKQRAFFKGKKA